MEVPWKDASFTEPITTTLTFTNEGAKTREFSARIQEYPLDFKAVLPDSLYPRDSATVTVDIHQPHYVFCASEYSLSLRILLPGLDRALAHTDSGVVEIGPHTLEYDYLDAVLLPLNVVGRQPPTGTDLLEIQREYYSKARAHYDTVVVPEGLPTYIRPLLEHTIELASFSESIVSHNYHLFFMEDTLSVPNAISDSLGRMLAQFAYYDSPEYNRSFICWAQFTGEADHNSAYDVTSNLMTSRARGYLKFPISERRADATASHLAYLLTDQRVYLNKSETIDTLRASLPESYQAAVATIERSATAKSASEKGLLHLLVTDYQTPDGSRRSIGSSSERKFRLLKFWFAGCVPCLAQQPYERELLAAYPNVELIYVAHNTQPDTWRAYLEEHKPPAARQYLVPKQQTKEVLAAAGTTGAPTYVMVDANGQAVCQPCPKPSDPLLRQFFD